MFRLCVRHNYIWTILLIVIFYLGAYSRILTARKRPVSMLTWLWAITLFPYIGPLFYFVFWYFPSGDELVAPFTVDILANRESISRKRSAAAPDLPQEPMPKSFALLLRAGTKRVWLATGYFVPDACLLYALKLCAVRGIDVRLLGSQKSDHPVFLRIVRSLYEELL